jgi:hypothetical protein
VLSPVFELALRCKHFLEYRPPSAYEICPNPPTAEEHWIEKIAQTAPFQWDVASMPGEEAVERLS